MNLLRLPAFALALAVLGAHGLTAQTLLPPPPPPPAYAPAPPPVYPGPNLSAQLSTLADQPARHAGFTFDRNMLSIAQSVLESSGMDARRAAVALTGISFDQYHYPQPAFYTPEAMAGLLESYRIAGWKHLVDANSTPANTAQPKRMATDLWLHFSGADIDAVTVLTRGARDMNVVQITGDLRPLDLLHLGGHFGIPKVDPGTIMVPAN